MSVRIVYADEKEHLKQEYRSGRFAARAATALLLEHLGMEEERANEIVAEIFHRIPNSIVKMAEEKGPDAAYELFLSKLREPAETPD